ncbi:hypothetical protein AABB24_031712 [Solanum stoloniferum]|uniref:Glycosyl transferase family 3 domain-containing protein n=1 Tax=Solanum stoloniferum TaxID=62892 RepID=A0ABD2RUS7_9SOLN
MALFQCRIPFSAVSPSLSPRIEFTKLFLGNSSNPFAKTTQKKFSSLCYALNDSNKHSSLSTFSEVVGLARAMIKHCRRVEGLGDTVDIVGTGGDGANTVNISTGASILAAACGAKVAKQGNRSSSSACGSADVLEELGVAIELDPEGVKECVNQAGIGFMMSPIYHPAMKIVRPIRKKLKVKTVFNILGPMLNPARVPFAVVGVYKEDLVYFRL